MNQLAVGVCSWSVDRHNPSRAIQAASEELRIGLVQLGFFGREAVLSADPQALANLASKHKVAICGTFVAFDGEDYSSIDAIACTGGLMPDEHFAQRLEVFRAAVQLTAVLAGEHPGCRSIAIHAGSIPADPASSTYATLIERCRHLAGACTEHRLRLLLETGRESADVLAHFIGQLQQPQVGINFDPANFIIYGADDPVKATTTLKPLISLVHLKDAARPAAPGTFGAAAAFGQGDVQIPRVVSKLRAAGYSGPLLIETPERAGIIAIREAANFLRSML